MSFLQLNQVTVVERFFFLIKLALAYRNFRIYLKIYNPYQKYLHLAMHLRNMCNVSVF